MTVLGSLSSVNLIAGAGILGNIGGVAITGNANLSSNLSLYTSVGVVNQFASVAGTGYVSVNIVANTFPALTNAVPTAYQGNLGTGTLTSVIVNQRDRILGSGDLGIFEQVLSSAQSLVSQTNQLIKSTINANRSDNTTGFTSQDNVITGGFSNVTEAFGAFGQDLIRLGLLIDLNNLNNLGSPAALLKQVDSQGNLPPGVATVLLEAGLPEDVADDVQGSNWTPALEKLAYQGMLKVTGTDLLQVLKLLKVTTTGLTNMADLLNPVKILPNSYITLTAPTANGLRGVYIDTSGTVNSSLATTLPESVLIPLQGNPQPNATTYSELRLIIPPDQALANKALEAALKQVKAIFNSTLPATASAVIGLESNVGLDLINALTEPLPPNVVAYFTSQFNTGTGQDGLLLLTDVIGTPTGWIMNTNLANTTAILNLMTSANAFVNLTNSASGIYTVMANTASGIYTTEIANVYTTTIPGGFPGAGSYSGSSASESIQLAFTNGLNPAMVSTVNTIVSNNSNSVSQTNSNWANISAQISRENVNLELAQVDFANLTPGVEPIGLVLNLSQFGLDTAEGGSAFVMESVANIASIGGQAIISTMRESRNQARLNTAGIETTIIVSEEVVQPQATLSTGQYTVSQAVNNKII